MKLYYIGPNVRPAMPEDVIKQISQTAVHPIADLILSYFRADGFAALIGLSVLNRPNPGGEDREETPAVPQVGARHESFGCCRVTHFQSEDEVYAALIEMGDCYAVPTSPGYFWIRSVISCRSVFYGYDGQAFLCLRTEDQPPTSPNQDIVLVEERSELLLSTDYLDGVEAAEH